MRVRIVAIAAALGAILAPVAFADQPSTAPLGNVDFTLAAGTSCAFPVAFHFYGDKEIVKTFSSGHMLITGHLGSIVTNLNTDTALNLNISGPGQVIENADGTTTAVLFGRSAFPFFSTDRVGPGLLLTSGPMRLTFDASGNVIDRVISGNVVDLCLALA